MWDDIAPVGALAEPFTTALSALFTVQPPSAKENTPSGGGSTARRPPPGSVVRVIPLPRANNISITLKQFESFGGYAAIKDALLSGNSSLTREHLERLAQIAPTQEEMKALSLYRGTPSDLSPPEQFILVMMGIPRLHAKISSLLFMRQFSGLCEDAGGGLRAVKRACEQLRTSRRLKCVLAAVLACGNAINAGTHRGNAEAIKLESLLKLGDVKTTTAAVNTMMAKNSNGNGGGGGEKRNVASGGKAAKKEKGKEQEEEEEEKSKNAANTKNSTGPNSSLPFLPPARTLLDFVAWKVLQDELSGGENDEDKSNVTLSSLESSARHGYLTQDLNCIGDAVRRMQADVLDALKALDSGMSTVKREYEAANASAVEGKDAGGTATATTTATAGGRVMGWELDRLCSPSIWSRPRVVVVVLLVLMKRRNNFLRMKKKRRAKDKIDSEGC